MGFILEDKVANMSTTISKCRIAPINMALAAEGRFAVESTSGAKAKFVFHLEGTG
jgi:hypothetical protein